MLIGIVFRGARLSKNRRIIHQHRAYWTNQTIVSKSPSGLLEDVRKLVTLPDAIPPRHLRSPILFSISKHLPSKELKDLVELLRKLDPAYEIIGCLSDPLGPTDLETPRDSYSVALSIWRGRSDDTETQKVVTFKSNVIPRPSIAVGREILPNQDDLKHSQELDLALDSHGQTSLDNQESRWDDLWSRKISRDEIPVELQSIPPKDVKALIFFTAPNLQSFTDGLKRAFPTAAILGLVAASTPFETGRPCTLFHDQWIGDTGAVGVALVDRSSPVPSVRPRLRYHGLLPLGKPMKVTSSRGNMILSLNSENAAQTLMKSITSITPSESGTSHPIQKETEVFAAFFSDNLEQEIHPPTFLSEDLVEVCRIVGGAPSRGVLGIDRADPIPIGQSIQFVYRDVSHEGKMNALDGQFEFGCALNSKSGHLPERLKTTFIASSQHGFVINPKGNPMLVSVDGARGAL